MLPGMAMSYLQTLSRKVTAPVPYGPGAQVRTLRRLQDTDDWECLQEWSGAADQHQGGVH